MNILSAEQILQVQDLKIEKLDLPEWGGTICLRTMRSVDRDQFEMLMTDRGPKKNVRAKLASMTICDEAGTLMFSEKQVDSLGNKSAKALQKIFTKALEMNNFSDDDVDELEGNS